MVEVEICQDGKVYKQRYERGQVCYPLKEIGTCDIDKTGSKITFLPDKTIFTETTVFDFDILKIRLREMAFLTKGLRIILRDGRREEDLIKEHENSQINELLRRAQEDKDADDGQPEDNNFSSDQSNDSLTEENQAGQDEESKEESAGVSEKKFKERVVEFHYEGGIKEFVSYLNKSKEPLYENILYFEGQKNNVYVEVAFQR